MAEAEAIPQQYHYHAERAQELNSLNLFRSQNYIRAEVWAGNLFSVDFLHFLVERTEALLSDESGTPGSNETKKTIEHGLLVLLVHWGGGETHEKLMLLFNLVSVERVQTILNNASGWIEALAPAEDFFSPAKVTERVQQFSATGLTPIMGIIDFQTWHVPRIGTRGHNQIEMVRIMFIRDYQGKWIYTEGFPARLSEWECYTTSRLYRGQLCGVKGKEFPRFRCGKAPHCRLGETAVFTPALLIDTVRAITIDIGLSVVTNTAASN